MKKVSPSTVVPSKYVPHLINDAVHATTSTFYSPSMDDQLQNNMLNRNDDSGSINMMEFLETILFSSSDETQTSQNQSHVHLPTSGSSAMPILQQPTSLQNNTSWAAYHNGIAQQHLQNPNNGNFLNPNLHRQETYGETMSLEEFLMKSGALEVTNPAGHDHHHLAPSIQPAAAVTMQTLAYNPNNSSNNYNMDSALLMEAAAILEVAPPQINSTSAGGATATSFDHNPVNVVILQGDDDEGDENGKETEKRGRKRKGVVEGLAMEVVRERRVQRMIKNRESASKSRTRKLTYTHQLEAELAQIRAENESLKNQVVHLMSKMDQMQQYEEMKQKDDAVRKLRRSSSYPSSSFM